jgi:hypothetical protein
VGVSQSRSVGSQISNAHAARQQFERDKYWHREQANLQREFAQKSLGWKLKDAKRHGIHPLAALGAQTYNASPTMVGGTPISGYGDSMASMGQDIGRAIMAQTTPQERKLVDLQLRSAKADTEMKELELTSARRRLTGQIAPSTGVETVPSRITAHEKGRKSKEAGSLPSFTFINNPDGSKTPVPSKDAKERVEDQLIPETVWAAQNYIGPNFSPEKYKPSLKELPKGYKDWEWKSSSFKWVPVKHKSQSFFGKVKSWWKKNIYNPTKKRTDYQKQKNIQKRVKRYRGK